MLIDVSDANTIPMEVKDKIVSSFSNLTSDIIEMIKKKSIDDEDSMMRTIKKCYGYSKTNRLYLDLENILKKYEIVCFHSTKMLSKNRVREYGLNTNEWNKYRANIIDTYERLGVSRDKIDVAITFLQKAYKERYLDIGCLPHLCFYSNLSMLEETDGSVGYNVFCENIGGELALYALKGNYPNLYKLLKDNGESFVVKFKIPYSKISCYRKEDILLHLITYYAGVYFKSKKYNIEFIAETQFDIPQKDILAIIDYNKVIRY
ncbi:hypothetical protein [Mediterraneibacter sp.]